MPTVKTTKTKIPKLKIGDRVRITKEHFLKYGNVYLGMGVKQNAIGKITSISYDTGYVKFPSQKDTIAIYLADLEPATGIAFNHPLTDMFARK